MEKRSDIGNVEIERPLLKKNIFRLNQKEMARLKVSPSQVTTVLLSFVGGATLFDLVREDETVEVKILVGEQFNREIENIYQMRVSNALKPDFS